MGINNHCFNHFEVLNLLLSLQNRSNLNIPFITKMKKGKINPSEIKEDDQVQIGRLHFKPKKKKNSGSKEKISNQIENWTSKSE
jgi:hypothetical protein